MQQWPQTNKIILNGKIFLNGWSDLVIYHECTQPEQFS